MATTYSDVISISTLPDAMRVIYSEELEFTAKPSLIFDQFCDVKSDFATLHGQQVYWTIFRQLPPAITALTENQDVDASKMQDFQISLTVNEYGYAIGTTEKLDLLSYFGPISNIVRQVLAPQMALTTDILARNAFYGSGATYRSYGGTATTRAGLVVTDTITSNLVRKMSHNLTVRRVPIIGNGYLALAHPSITYDLRGDSNWLNAQYYAGTQNIFTGETGMLHGVRFIESDIARLPNAGTASFEWTLSASAAAGATTITVASATGAAPAAGDEITIYTASASTPDGCQPSEEHVVVLSYSFPTVTLASKLLSDHASGEKVRDGIDVYPIVFLGGQRPVGKGLVVSPEVRVAMPTDKLHRIHYVGWYALYGFGVLRPWTFEVCEVAASVGSAPAFPW